MDALLLMVVCGGGYLIAYHTYGRFLARKIFKLDKSAPVPSEQLRDGVDYVPTKKGIIFGHHYTSIAGTGPIVGPALFPAPPSLHTKAARDFKDGRIFHVITRGQNTMPSYADKLTVEDRWAVIHFVRALQRALHPKPEDLKQPEDLK